MAVPIRNIVFGCPEGTWSGDHWEGAPRVLAEFYASLLGLRVTREDWLVIAADETTFPRLAFGEGPSELFEPPHWPDPERPQQVHLDFHVPTDGSVGALAERLGATRMPEMGGSCPVYTDPASHPFCLCSPGE